MSEPVIAIVLVLVINLVSAVVVRCIARRCGQDPRNSEVYQFNIWSIGAAVVMLFIVAIYYTYLGLHYGP